MVKYFVGQIMNKESSTTVKFLQCRGIFLTLIENEDSSYVDIENYINNSPEPKFDCRLHLTFLIINFFIIYIGLNSKWGI